MKRAELGLSSSVESVVSNLQGKLRAGSATSGRTISNGVRKTVVSASMSAQLARPLTSKAQSLQVDRNERSSGP